MSKFAQLIGTLATSFKLGLTGVLLKNNAGNLTVRNNADSADASLTTSQLLNSGDNLIINSDAANTGADYAFTLARPATGMSAAVTLTFPVSSGALGQAMVSDGNGVLSWTTLQAGASSINTDTTTLAFGSTSPLTCFVLPANAVVNAVRICVDTAFNGTPSLSIGVTGTTSKYLASNQLDLKQATVFEVYPGLPANTSTETVIATYSAGGATVGSARIEVDFVVPS